MSSCFIDPPPPVVAAEVSFHQFRVATEVIVVAIRWYLPVHLSYRDAEELRIERGVKVDHVTRPIGVSAGRACEAHPVRHR